MIINVIQKIVSLEGLKTDTDVKKLVNQEIGTSTVVKFLISPTSIVFYLKAEGVGIGIEVEDENFFSTDAVVDELLLKFPDAFTSTGSTVTYGTKVDEFSDNMRNLVDSYIGKRIPNSQIEFVNGGVQIFEPNGNIVLLLDMYILERDPASFVITDESERNTTIIRRSDTVRGIDVLGKVSEMSVQEHSITQTKEIISAIDDIENGTYQKERNTYAYSADDKVDVNITEAKSSDGQVSTEGTDNIKVPTSVGINIENTDDYLEAMSIGDTITETIKAKVAVISVTAFDEYASNHNVIGWNLTSPNTLQIKYLEEGTTTTSKIVEFHDMINSSSPALVNQTSDSVKFLTEFNEVLDTDLVQEFLNRVTNHNKFVRESTAKIRAALIDMENDFKILKDDVNLVIDWESSTAHASRKERIEHRTVGVKSTYDNSSKNTVSGNIVRVNSGLSTGDFYIPTALLTDELRSKYVFDDETHYIDYVPQFAFYEVPLNGHIMLIEKTDL